MSQVLTFPGPKGGTGKTCILLHFAYFLGKAVHEDMLDDAAAVLVRDARELVAGCPCPAGCPACVGPVLPGDESRALTPKAAALAVLGLLDGA